jgi:hypothetical protein
VRRIPGRSVATALIAVTSFAAPSAAAASPSPPTRFCATLISPERDGAGHSAVLLRSCSTSSPMAAAAAFPAVSVKLMSWYRDAGRTGTSDDIYGSQGTCDSEGYSFTPNSWWRSNMSSIRGYGSCNGVWLVNHNGAAGFDYLPASFGATQFNDDVQWLNVVHRQ